MTLSEAMADPKRYEAIVAACVRLVEDEVAGRRGFSGAALKAGFAAFQRIRPGIVRAAIVKLLPEFAVPLDRHWTRALETGDTDGYFRRNDRGVATDLLAVTDAMAARASNRALVKLYRSLRGAAQDEVAAAVPRIPAVIRAHTAA